MYEATQQTITQDKHVGVEQYTPVSYNPVQYSVMFQDVNIYAGLY